MYEDKTIDNIQIELLENVSDIYEKSAGFPTYDLLKSFAIEENKLYLILQSMMDKLDVDKLTGNELTKYVLQRKGIVRKLATSSIGNLELVGTGNIKVGDLFSTPNLKQFIAIENITIVGTGTIKVEAVVEGITGNVGSNSITQIPVTLAGIVSCNNLQATSGGYEEETDDSLRSRYYEALRLPANSGNIYHYLKWAKEVTGVGEAKVIPLWNGAYTVKVVIINSNKQVASSDLVQSVQEYIDPKGTYDAINNMWSTWGTGSGEAPLGAYCTIVSAISKAIDIEVDIQEDTNYTLADVIVNVETNIINYLTEIAFKQNYVSYAKIGNVILNTDGVEDYTTLKVNNTTANIIINNEEVAVLGDVVII